MAVRAYLLFGSRLWAAGSSAMMCSNPPLRSIAFFSRASPATASPGSNIATDTTTNSSGSEDTTAASPIISSSSGEVDVDLDEILATGNSDSSSNSSSSAIIFSSSGEVDQDIDDILASNNRDAADRIAKAAAALDARASRGGFVPSASDAHLGGPGAAAMGGMVAAVYSTFSGDGRTVERSVEHLTSSMAGIPHRPLNTRWARAHTTSSSKEEEEAEAAAIRETLAAYRFAGMGSRTFTSEPEAPAEPPADAAAAAAEAPAQAATAPAGGRA
ncbi:hypothetical protein OEZ86_010419 [Tetradesmus obliquus]|nr:hypothetical protein OEZ86_010419 [Tetradesmus obliquus]